MLFKNKKKKEQPDLNQRVSKYQRWWQDQTSGFSLSRSVKAAKRSPGSRLKAEEPQKVWDDSFVYYEGN